MHRLSVSLLLLIFCRILSAQSSVDTSQVAEQAIKEVTVQAPISFLSKLSFAGSYAELNNQDIVSGNAYLLSEQINTIPGVFMQQGTLNTNRITIRGIGSRTPYNSNRIKAYWGQMPLTDAEGVTSIEDIGLNDMSGIKVVKGPSSSLYGSGMGGAIVIDPFNFSKDQPGFSYQGELGSYSTYSNNFNADLIQSPKRNVSLVGSALNSEGYRQNSNFERYSITLKGQQKINRSYLNVLYNYRFLNGQIPSSLDSSDFINHPQKAADNWYRVLGYEQSNRHLLSIGLVSAFKACWVNSFTLFGGYSKSKEVRPFNEQRDDRLTLGFREKLSYTGKAVRAEIGVEYLHELYDVSFYEVDEEIKGDFINGNKQRHWYYNVFALMHWNINSRLNLQASVNINQTGYRIISSKPVSQADNYKYAPIVSPRLGINYNIFASTFLFGSVGHGFSSPSVEEAQMPNGLFNPSINPEEGMNYELGLRSESGNKKWYADATFYLMKMKNLLVTKRESEEVFYGINAGKTSHAGFEALVTYRLFTTDNNRALELSANYFTSENTFDVFVDDGIDYGGKHLPGIPAHNFGFNLFGKHKAFSLNANYKKVGSQFLTDDNTKKYQAYDKVGAKLTYNFIFNRIGAAVYIGCDNVFDNHYASMVLINAPSFGGKAPRYYYPGLPFNVFGGVNIHF
ncbi:hypothetical protein E9993_06435 [Labilibacter sediminis]|nr:hypothetical protein E9993_06435 [Labilibacter sediminis]